MSKITIEDVTKIIFDIKDKHNVTDKKFEIFALAAVLDELKMEDFYNLSILRTSGDKSDADYPFQIEFPTNYDLYGRYDKEKKIFGAVDDNHGRKSTSHAVHTDKEMVILKDIYNIFENNESFIDFKNDFINHLSKKMDKDYIQQLEILYEKSYDLKKLIFFKHLKDVITVDTITDRIDQIDIGLNLYRTAIFGLRSVSESDFSPEDSVHIAVKKGTIDEKIQSRHFEHLCKFDNLKTNYREDYLTEDDIVKIKQLLKTEYVKNNTVMGFAMNEDLPLSEKFFGFVGLFYDELRNDFLPSLEDLTMLKTREQMSANFHIDEIKEKILEAFPDAFNEKNLRAVQSVEVGEFTSDIKQSGIQYRDYLRSLKPFGLIRGLDLLNNSNFDVNHDAFFEETYSTGKRVTLKSINEVETLYQYTFKEYDVYGTKLLETKDIYMSKELGHGGFNNSLDDIIKYAKENNCVIVTSEHIDDNLLYGSFEEHLKRYQYENVVFYDRNSYEQKNHLNIVMGIQKEAGDKMTFKDHVKLKEFIESKPYVDSDEIIMKAKELLKPKKEKKSKINGPN